MKSDRRFCFFRQAIPATVVFLQISAASFVLAADAGAPAYTDGNGNSQAIKGIVESVILDDFNRGKSRKAYFLRDESSNRHYELEFEGNKPASLKIGQRVTVKGRQEGRKLYVEALGEDTLATTDVQSSSVEAMATERRAVVLLVDLIDAKASTNYTSEQIATNMWTGTRSVKGLYEESSLSQLTFTTDSDSNGEPDVVGPFEVPYSASEGCNFYDWASAAETAAQDAGIDLSLYQHRIFVLPRYNELPSCTWSGVANIGCGTYCRAWIAEGESPMVFAHELGHNLSMAHAGTDPENDGLMNSTYGDYSDPMGLSREWHVFNAAHADQMGWYAMYPGMVIEVNSSGVYDIAAMGLDPLTENMPFVLKIKKPDTGDYYYLSYRQPIGYDDSLSTIYTRGVNIHRYQGSGYGYTYFINSLEDLSTFSDEANNITVRQFISNNNYAEVEVTIGSIADTCTSTTPDIILTPTEKSVQRGTLASYTVSVTNKDTTTCAQTTFDLAYDGALSGQLTAATLAISPNETASATLEIDTATTADGVYALPVLATDSDGLSPDHESAGTSTTWITIDGTPPSVPTGVNGSLTTDGSVQLAWQAATDVLSGVASYTVYRDGIAIGNMSSTEYIDSNTSTGAIYTYTVTATDGVGNVSLPSTAASVSVPSTGSTSSTGSNMHVSDLEGVGIKEKGATWGAQVTITVHDGSDNTVSGATVSGIWNNGDMSGVSCTTDESGQCAVSTGNISKKVERLTFTVSGVTHAVLTYEPGANHDLDGDSDGTLIEVIKP